MSDHLMILIYFVYGLSFFVLGSAVFLQFRRESAFGMSRQVWLLGLFGLLHGANEWVDMFVLVAPEHAGELSLLRAILLVTSFYCLALFGGRTIDASNVGDSPFFRSLPHGLLTVVIIMIIFSHDSMMAVNLWSRYLLALPGSLMAAYGLFFGTEDIRETKNRREIWNLKLAATGFGLYAFFAGLIVPDSPIMMSIQFSYSEFRSLTGLPVQVFRTVCAMVMAYGFVGTLRIFEWERELAIERSEELYRSFTQNFQGIAFRVTPEGKPLFFRGAVFEITGYAEDELMADGSKWAGIIHPADVAGRRLPKPESGDSAVNIFRIIRKDGMYRWVREDLRVVKQDGECDSLIQGSVYDISSEKEIEQKLHDQNLRLEELVRDRTSDLLAANLRLQHEIDDHKATELSLQKLLAEKVQLLREVHHRVKNNLQIVSSLLKLRSDGVDEKYLDLIRDSQNRIRSMALAHEKLYDSKDLADIPVRGYLSMLVRNVIGSFEAGGRVAVHVDVEDITLNVNTAIPFGIVVNEIISIYMKHAFQEGAKGNIFISVKRASGGEYDYELAIGSDTVCACSSTELEAKEPVGIMLVNSLLDGQLEGSVRLPDKGHPEFRILFKGINNAGRA